LIRKTLKGAVNNGGDGDEMKIASGEFGDPKMWRQISTHQAQMGAEQGAEAQ
jgi:hypothetical protein